MTTQKYLFHNIYGDAQTLIDTKPNDVTTVPFGWDPQAETIRDSMLNLLGVKVAGLPAVVAWREEYITTSPDPLDLPKTMPAGWFVLHLNDVPQSNWNWGYVQSVIDGWGDELDYL